MGCSIPLNKTLSKQMMTTSEKQHYAKQSCKNEQQIDLRHLLNLTLNEGGRIQEDRLFKYLLQRIPRTYQMDQILNLSSSGLVFKAIQIKTQIPFAIKIISKPLSIDEHSHIRKYLEILNALSSDCCIITYEQFMIERNIYMVMDYFELGTLHNYLMKQDKRLQEGTIKNIMLSLCLAVKHIHSKGIVHRNLKPSNIFLRDDVVFDLVIGGFGHADCCPNNLNRGCRVQEFMAKDVVINTEVKDYQIDVYSLGTICFLLFNGYEMGQNTQSVERDPPSISYQAQNFINKCIEIKPHKRITINEALEHPWFNSNIIDLNILKGGRRNQHKYNQE